MIWEGFPHLQLRLLPATEGPAKAASAAVAAPGSLVVLTAGLLFRS